MIDRRASMILLTVLIGLIALPSFAALVKLQTGDRLAQWPLGSGLVLAATWWVCLQWGPVGFVAVVVMLIVTSLQLLKLFIDRNANVDLPI
jgi:apolipoprotein N-acyltransferase